MKKIVMSAILLMLVATTVSASSLNGDYKGNPIVKLKSNGTLVDTGEVPAMIYDGKTMVPIAALRNLGADVTWDQNAYSVDVKIPTSPIENKSEDISRLKTYSKIAEYYKRLNALGDILSSVSQSNNRAYVNIDRNFKVSDSVNDANKTFNHAVDSYNSAIPMVQTIIAEASKYNISITDMNAIISLYSKSIDYYREAYKGLENFANDKTDANFYNYANNDQKAFDSMNEARTSCLSKYFEYYNMIQNF